MKTFAFKNSQKYWSTRYSFSPRNYSRLDRDMFTSHPSGSHAIYIHGPKATSEKNTYYGLQSNSTIKFTFNNDPSQNKVYKNMSLEGSFNEKGVVGTFRANDSTDPGQSRPSSVRGWKEKGAHIHANISKSPNSGRANIVPVGVIRRAHQAFFPELTGAMGDMWTDTGKSQAEWLAPDSIANVLATDGTGPNGLAAILPYGLDRAYLLDNSLMSSDPEALTRAESRYLFLEVDFFPGYKDSSGKVKYMLAGVDDFDPSTLYGVSYESVEAPYLSDKGLCAFAKNKATGNFKRRKYTSSEDGGVGFTFDQTITASVDNTPTKEGLFVFLENSNVSDDGGGGNPPTETAFDCASTTIVIADGVIGDPVSVTSTVGAIESVVPGEYVKGTATYTVNLTVPGEYTNVGESFSCTVQGTGSEPPTVDPDLGVFTCTVADFTVFGGSDAIEGEPINYSLNFGTLAGDPPVYIAGNNTYEVSINIPKGYDNYEDGTIVCSDSATAFGADEERVGDLNGDGLVTSADLLEFLAQYGQEGDDLSADLNGDGNVGSSDLLSLLTVYGTDYTSEENRLKSASNDIAGYVTAMNAIISAASPLIVYAITPENVNGEAARGNYADVSLTFPGVDFELDIVNLDYEPTQLDHSR